MYALHRILAPIDFSKESDAALAYAALLGRKFGADIVIMHVWSRPVELVDPATGAMLKAVLQRLETTNSGVRARLEVGVPHRVIVRVAEEEACDVIVLGTQGRTGLARALLGSVAEKVVQRATVPVLTVRGPH